MADTKKDPFRPGKLIRIEVENRNCKGLALPAINGSDGASCEPGVSQHLIYEQDLSIVLDLVEPEPELIERAKKNFEASLKKVLREKGLDRLPPDNPEVVNALRASNESVETHFARIAMRDLKPLVRVTVLEKDIVQEQDRKDAEAKAQQAALIESITKKAAVDPELISAIVAATIEALDKRRQPSGGNGPGSSQPRR